MSEDKKEDEDPGDPDYLNVLKNSSNFTLKKKW